MVLPAVLSALAALLAGSAAAQLGPLPARSAVPFVKDGDVDCSWTMHDPREKWIRGGIARGDEDPIFILVNTTFDTWSDLGEHKLEVSTGDTARRVPAAAWASNAGGQAPGSISFYMNANLRKLIGGATSVLIWKDGKPVYYAALSGTPTAAELDACVLPPKGEDSDEE